MWIRSQDREFLMKVDNINLGIDVDNNEPSRLFIFVGGVTTSFTLGTYKSKERALEVLDEIEEYINIYEFKKSRKTLTYDDVVYQMPEEWLND